ncbi:hypothetical protein Dsin_027273 [Dipteronia sinensis]|uniref:Uncharacterized protein n=1 Tax=Dipteronia sinensis TaxID=43782 RepID=A0AAD9ZNN0_9ROSI|nr:hypothetical protein Dsin_027273 [Dipteronia sinensis]
MVAFFVDVVDERWKAAEALLVRVYLLAQAEVTVEERMPFRAEEAGGNRLT